MTGRPSMYRGQRRAGRGGFAVLVLAVSVAVAGAGAPTADGTAEATSRPETAAPATGRLATADIYQLALAAGLAPNAAVTAAAVALAESGGQVAVAGDEGLVDDEWGPSVGLWQIRCRHDATGTGAPRDCSRLTDPAFNAAAMAQVSAAGTNWQAWSAYTSGAYREHLGAAEAGAAEVGR